jgi:hypothetical protein
MNWKSLFPLLLTSMLTVATILSPTLTSLVANHPDIAGALVITAKFLHASLPSIFQTTTE